MVAQQRWLRYGGWALAVVAVTGWAVVGFYLYVLAAFAASDTRCGEYTRNPQVSGEGAIWVITTGLIWATPFVILVLVRRNRLTIALATIAVLISNVAAISIFTHPAAFCF
ncbi:hypothetical protein [Nocardia sp. NPDC127526]|uniref:hypothetical protein n=1 Tax=Nocardia sp. NPDC127526 TaxID=3345393 RepID=UPI0036383984